MRYVLAGLAGAALATGCATTRPAQVAAAPAEPEVVQAKVAPVAETRTAPAPQAHGPATKGESYTSKDLGFELDKPAGDKWAIATNVTSPEGRPIPVVVAHPESGAQIVVQVSEPVDTPEKLAGMLREKLQTEKSLQLGKPEKISIDSGSDAYGFNFKVKGEADGRVAVISCGEHVVLVVASWPENADKSIVTDIDGVVKSVRQPSDVNPAMMRPDKA